MKHPLREYKKKEKKYSTDTKQQSFFHGNLAVADLYLIYPFSIQDLYVTFSDRGKDSNS